MEIGSVYCLVRNGEEALPEIAEVLPSRIRRCLRHVADSGGAFASASEVDIVQTLVEVSAKP